MKIALAALCALIALDLQHARATSYECKAVDDLAVLAIDSGSVSISTDKKKCTFSVNGATSSNQQPQDMSGNDYFRQSMTRLFRDSQLFINNDLDDTLLEVLVRPFDDPSGYDMSFSNMISFDRNDIQQCLEQQGRSVERENFVCRMLQHDDMRSPSSLWNVTVVPSVPVLQIGVSFGDKSYQLFVPASLLDYIRAGRW